MKRLSIITCIALLSFIAGRCPADEAGGRPVWSVPVVGFAMDAKGLLGGGEWTSASMLSGFSCMGSGKLTCNQPTVWLGRDERCLYVAWRMRKPAGKPLVARTLKHDGQVWLDDSIEIFLDPGATGADYYQFIVNSKGTLYDGHERDGGWNSGCSVQTADNDKEWAGRISIPFEALGRRTPADGAQWGLNIAFDRSPAQRPLAGSQPEDGLIVWSPVASTLHEPERFGRMVFSLTGRTVLGLNAGMNWMSPVILTGPGVTGGDVSITDPAGKEVWRSKPDAAGAPSLMPGIYTLSFISRDEQGHTLASLAGRFEAIPYFDPEAQYLFGKRVIRLDAVFHGESTPPRAEILAELVGGSGKTLRSGTLLMMGGRATNPLTWSARDMISGKYKIVFRDPHSRRTLYEMAWNLPARPSWLGTKAGAIDDSWVPKPWTPLQVMSAEPLTVKCWGRRYTFGPSGLLKSVVSKGAEILSAPMTWDVSIGGHQVAWKPEPMKVTKRADGAIEFVSRQTGGGVRLTCTGRVEFDGFAKLKFALEAMRPGVILDSACVRMPFDRESSSLIHNSAPIPVWTHIDMKHFNAGSVPAGGWHAPFVFHLWLGNEERGLQWLCESDEGWRPRDPDRAIEIVPRARSRELRLNIIGKPTKFDRPREYTFAFQASPVKPMPENRHKIHYAQVAGYGIETAPFAHTSNISISYPAQGNIDLQRGTLEITLLPEFDSSGKGELNKAVFGVTWPDDKGALPENQFSFYWNQDDRGMRVVTREAGKYTRVYGVTMPWKPGEAHTVAFTWGGSGGIYIDRQRVSSNDDPSPLLKGIDLSKARIVLGGKDSQFTYRQIRISDVPRGPEELGASDSPLASDAHTLLLDRFDKVAAGKTSPLKIAAGGAGEISDGVRIVDRGLSTADPTPRQTALEHDKSIGLRTIGFHEHWTDWEGATTTSHGAELRSLIDGCHKQGIKLLLYHSWALADIAPEYPVLARECEVIDPNRFLYTREPKQTDYPICPQSIWQDYEVEGIDRLLREYGHDGIYTDGLTYPVYCSNPLHGCGYIGDDGKRHASAPVFALRETMKRVYRVLEQQGREMVWVAHSSGSITLPTLSFCSAYLDGEHLTGQPRPFRMPLDAFRAEFMGHNFGIPAYFLAYDWNQGITSDEGLALGLLHDTEEPWSVDQMSPVWRLWDEFGVEKSEFMPYWKPWGWRAPDGVKVSMYLKPDGDALIVVVNIGEKPVTGVVYLQSAVTSPTNALGGSPVTLVDGGLKDTFPSWRLRIYRAGISR